MSHCNELEKDLEDATEETQQLKEEVKKIREQEGYGDRRNRYVRVIQEKDDELNQVQAELLDLTKQYNMLREELEALMSEKIDAETSCRVAKDKHKLLERQIEQLKEHSKNQLASSREREQKLRDQITELGEYYEEQTSSLMKSDSLGGSLLDNDVTIIENDPVIKIPKDTQNDYKNFRAHSLKQQIKRSKRSKSTDSYSRRSTSAESNVS